MNSFPDPSQAKPPLQLSGRNLSVVSLVLFTLFGTIVLGSTLPPAIASPLWQLRLSLALINAAPFPLAGLALLHLAAELDPEDPVLQRRHRLCAQLAVPAVLGLLLLLPLQTAAGLRQDRLSGTAQNARISKAETKLAALRQAVATATDNEQLNRQLQALKGPVLSPADLAQPLARLRSQVGAALQEGEAQIQRERLSLPSRGPSASCPICCATAWPAWPKRSASPPSPSAPARRCPCSMNGASSGSTGARAQRCVVNGGGPSCKPKRTTSKPSARRNRRSSRGGNSSRQIPSHAEYQPTPKAAQR